MLREAVKPEFARDSVGVLLEQETRSPPSEPTSSADEIDAEPREPINIKNGFPEPQLVEKQKDPLAAVFPLSKTEFDHAATDAVLFRR